MGLFATLRWIVEHPLNQGRSLSALGRYVRWQVGSRLVPGPVAVPYVGEARLLIEPGMKGATGNIYCGLHEFSDMAFVLHLLRPDEVFIDVGANVGSYTILAAAGAGARCVSFEPHPRTFAKLLDNIRLNEVGGRVRAINTALGSERGRLRFSDGLDAVNHVIARDEQCARSLEVDVSLLDDFVLPIDRPVAIKMDVEGYEAEVVGGASRVLRADSLLAVIMEVNQSNERYGADAGALDREMLALGFEACRYEPFTRVLEVLSRPYRTEGNLIYVRNGAEVRQRLREAARFEVHGQQV